MCRVSIRFPGQKSVFLVLFGLHLQTVARYTWKGRVADLQAGLCEIDTYCRLRDAGQWPALVLYTACLSYYLLAKG
ncbi:MAG: hypothetical protein DRP66_07990 [Planctomycetota bacterium]|nr:MAG: hypothetical protein DRP66_07990 [Planctomycetota bacterium]